MRKLYSLISSFGAIVKYRSGEDCGAGTKKPGSIIKQNRFGSPWLFHEYRVENPMFREGCSFFAGNQEVAGKNKKNQTGLLTPGSIYDCVFPSKNRQ